MNNNLPYDITSPAAAARLSGAHYPDAFALNNSYRQLEGFTLNRSDASPLTMTDFYKATTVVAGDLPHHDEKDDWTDTLMTFVVMLALLVGSSVALGLAARQATLITQQLTRHTTQHALKNVSTPRSWQF